MFFIAIACIRSHGVENHNLTHGVHIYGSEFIGNNVKSGSIPTSTQLRPDTGLDTYGAIILTFVEDESIKDNVTANIQIFDTLIQDNHAIWGGALLIEGIADITFDGCTIQGNNASVSGGTVAFNNGSLNIFNSTIDGNAAGYQGGFVYAGTGGDIHMKNVTAMNNYALYGGVLVAHDALNIDLEDSLFDANIAELYGGAFWLFDAESLFIRNCTADNNVARLKNDTLSGGGFIRMTGIKQVDFEQVYFNNNQGGRAGGAISVSNDSDFSSVIHCNPCHASGNSAFNGGFLYSEEEFARIIFTNSTLENNTAR